MNNANPLAAEVESQFLFLGKFFESDNCMPLNASIKRQIARFPSAKALMEIAVSEFVNMLEIYNFTTIKRIRDTQNLRVEKCLPKVQ